MRFLDVKYVDKVADTKQRSDIHAKIFKDNYFVDSLASKCVIK